MNGTGPLSNLVIATVNTVANHIRSNDNDNQSAASTILANTVAPPPPPSATKASSSSSSTPPLSSLDAYLTYLRTQTKETLEHLLIVVVVYAIVCLVVYNLLHHHKPRKQPPPPTTTTTQPQPDEARPSSSLVPPPRLHQWAVRFPAVRRVLLVTAHPDDECMFFGPTLLALARRRNCQVYVLCLSSGNYDQLGSVRRDELWRACEVLRVPAEHITLVQATEMADDPQAVWHADVVGRHIQSLAGALSIDAVCTFDRDGVSRHPNHRAIFYATASLFLAGMLPPKCRVLTLDSTNALRKYTFVFDLLVTLLLGGQWCVASWPDVQRVRRAMAAHRSQMVWFRQLYVLCSRYMVINSWREMSASDVELELQIDEDT